MFLAKYRWIFMAITLALLGLALFKAWRNRTKTGPWSKGILCGTTVLTLGLIVYSMIYT